MNKKLVAAIDFGNDKLSIAIAYKNMDNSLELIDFWSKPLVSFGSFARTRLAVKRTIDIVEIGRAHV